jgi:hypothetical protein
MQDMQAYLRKLHLDAVDCALISKRATDPQKKELFDRLADHLGLFRASLDDVVPVTLTTHENAVALARDHRPPSIRSDRCFGDRGRLRHPLQRRHAARSKHLRSLSRQPVSRKLLVELASAYSAAHRQQGG